MQQLPAHHPHQSSSRRAHYLVPVGHHSTMCVFVLLVPTCYHNLFDTSCRLILEELQRINQPAAWEGSVLAEIPFAVPEPCLPGPHTIQLIYTSDSCDWECFDSPTRLTLENLARRPDRPLSAEHRDGRAPWMKEHWVAFPRNRKPRWAGNPVRQEYRRTAPLTRLCFVIVDIRPMFLIF